MAIYNYGVEVVFPVITDEERAKKTLIPSGKVDVVIDSDTKNEVDDQFAIAWAAKEKERINLLAVYAAPFSHDCIKKFTGQSMETVDEWVGFTYAEDPGVGTQLSYEEILKLYELMGEDPTGKVFKGSNAYIVDKGGAIESEAARDLIKKAHEVKDTLYVLAIGAITNVASAILLDPSIITKICVIWLGGQPTEFGHGIEFNLMQDTAAANVVFESGVPMVYIPCMSVASMLTLTEDEIKNNMIGKNPLSTYLGENCTEGFGAPEASSMINLFLRGMYLKGRDDQPMDYLGSFQTTKSSNSRIIWDISTVAAVVNPSWLCSKMVDAPVLNDDCSYKTERLNHKIREVNYIFRDYVFGEMFHALNEK